MQIDLTECDPVTAYKYNLLTGKLHDEAISMRISDAELCNFLLSCAVGIIARGSLDDESRLEDDMSKLKQAVIHIRDTIKADREKNPDEV